MRGASGGEVSFLWAPSVFPKPAGRTPTHPPLPGSPRTTPHSAFLLLKVVPFTATLADTRGGNFIGVDQHSSRSETPRAARHFPVSSKGQSQCEHLCSFFVFSASPRRHSAKATTRWLPAPSGTRSRSPWPKPRCSSKLSAPEPLAKSRPTTGDRSRLPRFCPTNMN